MYIGGAHQDGWDPVNVCKMVNGHVLNLRCTILNIGKFEK